MRIALLLLLSMLAGCGGSDHAAEIAQLRLELNVAKAELASVREALDQAAAATSPPMVVPKELTVEKLTIASADHRSQIQLIADRKEPAMLFLDESGRILAAFGIADGSASLSLFDTERREPTMLFVACPRKARARIDGFEFHNGGLSYSTARDYFSIFSLP